MERREFTLSPEQQHALQLMKDGKNVFLTGKAGTGKTEIIRRFKEECRKNVAYLAFTGKAAISIGGSTIHSYFGLPIGVLTPERVDDIQKKMGNRWDMLLYTDVILVDEVSMLRCDILNAMDYILRKVSKKKELPFGGRQVILCGDMGQLPPVVDDDDIKTFLKHYYGGEYVFYSQAWKNANLEVVNLTTSFRQNDNELLDIANAIRAGVADRSIKENSDVTYLDALNLRHSESLNGLSDDTMVMCSLKGHADEVNKREVAKLEDPGVVSYGKITGEFPDNDMPTNKKLTIKKGCRVMLLANRLSATGNTLYVNGSTGIITDYAKNKKGIEAMVMLDDGREVTVEPWTWESYEYTLGKNDDGELCIAQDKIGTFEQLPIAPAYAITIHKSQGLTIEAPVCIILGKRSCFASGMFYVALTRCRRLEQITLSRPVNGLDCKIDEDILEFYRDMHLI